MPDDAKRTLTPKLRFPEFQEGASWAIDRLNSVADFVSEKVHLSQIKLADYVSTENILSDFGGIMTASKLPLTGSVNRFQTGDILVSNIRPYLKKVWVSDRNGSASNDVIVVRAKPLLLDEFFPFVLKTDSFIEYVMTGAKGVKMPRGDIDLMKEYRVSYPSHSEQQKIANCLTSLDDAIAAQRRKVQMLTVHKKGLMQQLFPYEDETLPRLRFPEFYDAPAWEERKLEELAKRGSGHTPNKAKAEYYNGGIKWVSLADSRRLDNGFISTTSIEISEEGIANSSAVLHPAGTVIVSRDAGIGKSAVIKESMAVSQHFIVWTCNKKLLLNWFLYYLLQLMKPLLETVASGSTIKTIGLQFFIELRVTVPQVPEQQKIVDCLCSLDDQITAAFNKLTALKTYKKGLVQQLFPFLEKV